MEELHGRAPNRFVNNRTVHACRVDAGLGKLVPALFVAFVDEDLVIHRTGNDRELSMRDMRWGRGWLFLERALPHSIGLAAARRSRRRSTAF